MNKLILATEVAADIKFSDVAEVVVIGILLVFFILLLITIIMMIFPYLFGSKTKKLKEKVPDDYTINEINETNKQDDGELVSILTAAIAAYRASEGDSSELSTFRVVAFKKAPRISSK